jgi:hypothetical protein
MEWSLDQPFASDHGTILKRVRLSLVIEPLG